jgi:hypothetical protein
MTVPDAVEQVLWDEPPVMTCVGGYATADTNLGGQSVKAGDLLLLGLAAGNTDPFIRPDHATPVHGNRSHLAFSRGPHECPGQDIGRTITGIAVDTLLVRLPDVQLTDPAGLSWTSTTWSRHLNALPVAFTPRWATAAGEAGDIPYRPGLPHVTTPDQALETTPPPMEFPDLVAPPPSRWTAWWRRLRRQD